VAVALALRRSSSSATRRVGSASGHGKAREVPEAIRKATEAAKRSLVRVPLVRAVRFTMM
jgi:ribosomal protein S5